MDYVNVTCSCGYTDSLDAFCRTPLFGALSPGHFQCPSCNTAWQRKERDYRILESGSARTIIAGTVEVVPVEGRL